MMSADANLQVWLDTVPGTNPSVIIPYVQGPKTTTLQYWLTTIKQGRSGSSRIAQGGDVQIHAHQPTALSRFSISLGKDDTCRIELILVAQGKVAGTYHFDCPYPRQP